MGVPTAHPFWVQVIGEYPWLIRGPGVLQSWESSLISHRAAPPGFYQALPPIKYAWEDAHPWETPSQGSHHSYFVYIFYLAYISIILLARSKSVATKIFEIKYEKNARPCGTPNACDPAKRGLEWPRIELTMLDFCPEEE